MKTIYVGETQWRTKESLSIDCNEKAKPTIFDVNKKNKWFFLVGVFKQISDILPPMVFQVPKSPTSTSAYLQNSVPKKQVIVE